MRRRGDLLRAFVAFVVLAALVVGVPLFLVRAVGWPLPRRVPALRELRDAWAREGVSDRTVIKALAAVIWVGWLQLALGVGLEVWSVARKRAVPTIVVVPSVRRGVKALVGAIVVVTSVGGPRGSAFAHPPRPVLAVPSATVAAGREARAVPGGPRWRVRPRDTLWGIAEKTLGRGERWREIQRLNADRDVGGGVVFAAGQELIRPGWVLALPADAVLPADTPPPGEAPTVYEVVAGDSLHSIAEGHYGDARAWRVIWEANRGRRFGGRTFDDPDLIVVGWSLDLPPLPSAPAPPAVAEPSAAAPAPTDAPTATDSRPAANASTAIVETRATTDVARTTYDSTPATTATTAPPAADTPGDPPSAAESPTPPWVRPAGLSGAALLATGALGLLASRRRRRVERMARGQSLPLPDPDLAPTDAALRLGADPEGIARVDIALRALAGSLALDERARPLALRRFANGALEVRFADGDPAAPPGWEAVAPGVLQLPASVPIELLSARAEPFPPPCPALVLLGCTGDAECYVDLEALGVLVVEGPTVVAQALARGVVATLAVSPVVDELTVVTSGVDCYGFGNERRVISTTGFAAAADMARELAAPIARHLGAGITTFSLRRAYPDEPWEPVVVVALRDRHVGPAEVAALGGGGGRGVGVVTDIAVPGAARLAADAEGRWHVEPFGWVVTPAGLAAHELADLGALLADALAAPVDLDPAPTEPPAATAENRTDEGWTLLVRLLGPVDVVDRAGRAAVFARSKALELVVWLAEHRANPLRAAARTALWAADVRDATFANVVSDARRGLGALATPPDDDEWIGRLGGDRLILHPAVRTDAELLAAVLAEAQRVDEASAVEVLRRGLALVRDAPFAGTDYLWPDGEALPSNLVVLVTTAAAELAARCLARGDPEGAFWATSQGLKVLPAHDELVCLRMEAHAAGGNLAGVRLEFEAYEHALAADPWGDAEPSAKVRATRARLLRPAPH